MLFRLSRKSGQAPILLRQDMQTTEYSSCCIFLLWFRKYGGRFDHSNLPRLSRSAVQGGATEVPQAFSRWNSVIVLFVKAHGH